MERATRRSAVPVIAVVVAAFLLLGGTWAWWTSEASFGGGRITAGDLALDAGPTTWHQVTPGVTAPLSGVVAAAAPEDVFTMPGDVIEFVQPVSTTLRGDNIAGGMTVRFADSEDIAEDIESGRIDVGFVVRDAAGTQVAPATGEAALGSTVVVPGMTGTEAGVTADWTVVIRVDVLGDYVWADGAPITAAGLWSTGEVVVELRQVREGEGFGGDL